jgi:hypothetical protein
MCRYVTHFGVDFSSSSFKPHVALSSSASAGKGHQAEVSKEPGLLMRPRHPAPA